MTTEPATPPAPATPAWARWFTVAVTLVSIVALVITVASVGPATLYGQLRTIGLWFVLILALEAVATLCDALVLHGFLGPGGRRPSFRRVVAAQIAGRAVNVVTPLGSLGEATKATLLMRDTDSGRAVATVVRFNLAFIAANLAFVLVGAPLCAALLPLPAWITRSLWIGTAVSVVVGAGLLLMVRAGLVATLIRVLRGLRIISRPRFDVWRARLRKLDATMRGERGLRSWLPGLWTLPSKAVIWVGVWLVLYANGEPPSIGVMAALASAGTVVNVASNVVPLGLGVSEGGTAALMAALGESPALGVTIVVTRRVVTLIYAAIGLAVLAAASAGTARGRRPPAHADRPADHADPPR